MQQLKFRDESDAALEQLSGEKLKEFIAEYKRVVGIASRLTGSRTWSRQGEIKASQHELPEGSCVSCMTADEDTLYLGMKNGRLLTWNLSEQKMTSVQSHSRSTICAILPVRGTIWCALDGGTGYAVLRDNNSVAKSVITIHDKKHSYIRRLAYDRSRDGVWSVATTPSTSTAKETQITYMASSALTYQKSIIVPNKLATDIALFGGLVWVSYESGEIITYNNVTGAAVKTYTLFDMNEFGASVHLATPVTDQLWISYGTQLRILTTAAYNANNAAPEFVTRDVMSACKESKSTSFLQTLRIPIQNGSAANARGTNGTCEAVVTVDADGSSTIWNCSEMACEAWLTGNVVPTDGSSLVSATGSSVTTNPTGKTFCFWAASSGNILHIWSF